MRTLLDANACLRYLLNDIEDQADEVTLAIERGAEVTIEVLAEVVYVLAGVYGVDCVTIQNILTQLLDEVHCARADVGKKSLKYYSKYNLDFVDCILLAESTVNGRSVLTFDKKLKNKIKALKV